MSKKVIKSALVVAVIALSFPLSTEAQTSKTSHFSQTYPLDNHNVVREYNYPVTIASAVSQLGISQFYYNVTGQSVVSAFLKASNVYDFVIDNDTVFYCGKENDGNGLIGFFNIQDLFFNGGRFYFSMDFPINYYNVGQDQECYYAESFNKLVTYRDAMGKRHIVCVGQTRGNGGARPCIVDLFSDPNGAYLAYNAGMIDDTNIAGGMLDIKRFCTAAYPALDDMTRPALPCDYLVVAGVDNDSNLSLRFFDAQDPLAVTGPQNTFYVFDSYYNPNRQRHVIDPLIYPMSDSTIAVASVLHYWMGNIGLVNLINFNEINIHQLLSGSATSMVRSVDMKTSAVGETTKLNQFVYNTSTSRFAALFEGFTQSNGITKSYFVEVNYWLNSALNLLTGYEANSTCVDKGFTGLDLYNSKSQYVLFGKCSGNVYQHNVGIETSGSASHCQPQTTATFTEVDSRTSHSFNSEVLILGWRNNIKSLSAMIETGNIEIDCNQ